MEDFSPLLNILNFCAHNSNDKERIFCVHSSNDFCAHNDKERMHWIGIVHAAHFTRGKSGLKS